MELNQNGADDTFDLQQSLLDLTPVGIFFLDRTGHIVRSNQACWRLLGFEPEEFESLTFGDVVAKRHLGLAKAVFERTIKGRPQKTELLLTSKTGQLITVDLQTIPYTVNGQIVGAIGTAQDLNRIRAMEQALGDHENIMQLALRMAHVGRWVWNHQRHEIEASPELFELLHLDPTTTDPVTIESFVETICPDDRGPVRSALLDAIGREHGLNMQFRILGPESATRTFQAMAEPRRDPDGEFLGLIGMIQDITEVTHLTESQQQLAAIFEHSRDLVMVVNVRGFIQYFNRTSRLTLGLSESEPLGHLHLSEVQDPEQETIGVNERLAIASREGVWRGDLWLKHRDGHAIPVSSVIQCHRDEHGHPRFFSGIARDVTHERALQEHIRFQAEHDTLTGLLNRGRFTELLGEYIASLAPDSLATIGFIDLNDFKQVNDVHGHTIGDHLLAAVAQRLSDHFDSRDILARWGGDEFTFWLPNSGCREATEWLACLLPDLERPYTVHDLPFECLPAIGLAVYPTDGRDVETLVRKADAAMFEAKRRGIPYLFHTATLVAEADRRTATRDALRQGLRDQQFVPYFQPIVAADSCRLEGAEALVRWNHPTRGLLLPAEFIAEAERSALIIPLGLNMVEMVGQALNDWHARGLEPIRLAVNLSARQLAYDNLAETIYRITDSYHLDPFYLECEITETAILENHDLARRTLEDLQRYGFRVMLDDFGTGYSSLSHLRDLPIDGIKLDRSFVEKLPDHPRETAIARSTIRLAHDLALTVTAEGVETKAEAAFLIDEGCDYLQGYGISRPLDADTFLHWRQDYRPGPIG